MFFFLYFVIPAIEITDLTVAKREDTNTELTVCFIENQLPEKTPIEKESLLYKLVTEDANGLQLRMTSSLSPASISVVEGKPCLGPLPLDSDFDLTDKVRILVTREDVGTHEVAAGDVELFLLGEFGFPSILLCVRVLPREVLGAKDPATRFMYWFDTVMLLFFISLYPYHLLITLSLLWHVLFSSFRTPFHCYYFSSLCILII